jgi:hypothetical protein
MLLEITVYDSLELSWRGFPLFIPAREFAVDIAGAAPTRPYITEPFQLARSTQLNSPQQPLDPVIFHHAQKRYERLHGSTTRVARQHL